jgi:valyl-tRNA synthetase
VLVGAGEQLSGQAKNWDETLKRLARLSDISFAAEPPQKSVQLIVRGTVAALPLQGVIDFDAEKIRLAKEIAKLLSEAKKTEAKLGNADFVARAPEEVVEENRDRLTEALARASKLQAALERLS